MPSVWDNPNQFRSQWVPSGAGGAGGFRQATPEEIAQQDKYRDEQRRRSRNSFIKNSILGTAGVVAGGYGLAALTGGLGAGGVASVPGVVPGAPVTAATQNAAMGLGIPTVTGGAAPTVGAGVVTGLPAVGTVGSNALPAGVTAGWETNSPIVGNIANNTAPGGNWFTRMFTGRDLAQLGTGAVNAGLNIYGTNKANQTAAQAAEAQQRQFDATQAFLKEQAATAHQDYQDWVEEQRRQYDMTEAEKRRRYEAREPWRQAGLGNLTRMNTLMDMPTPMPSGDSPIAFAEWRRQGRG